VLRQGVQQEAYGGRWREEGIRKVERRTKGKQQKRYSTRENVQGESIEGGRYGRKDREMEEGRKGTVFELSA